MIEYCAGFLFTPSKEEVALVLKTKGPPALHGKLNGIGGKLELNETPYQAMVREFEEEAGLKVLDWNLFCTLKGNDLRGEFKIYFYKSFQGGIVKTMEEEKVGWYPSDIYMRKNAKIVTNLRFLLPLALNKDNCFAAIKENDT